MYLPKLDFGGDWSSDKSVLCYKSLGSNKAVTIRNPNATEIFQDDELSKLIKWLLYIRRYYKKNLLQGESFNFGPNDNHN